MRISDWSSDVCFSDLYIFTALAVDGDPQYGHLIIDTPEDARAIVGIAKANGYSFIKAYTNLSAEAFAALTDEAKRQGIRVVGHNVKAVGLARQLAAGQAMFAHVDAFFHGFFPDTPAHEPHAPPPNATTHHPTPLVHPQAPLPPTPPSTHP